MKPKNYIDLVNVAFAKHDGSKITLTYVPFDNAHSKLWLKSVNEVITSGKTLDDVDRVYNFIDAHTELLHLLDKCNDVIQNINSVYKTNAQLIRIDNLQEDVNNVHTYFVEHESSDPNETLWSLLNSYLHGLEIIERRDNSFCGQVFCRLPGAPRYEVPHDSYQFFTTAKTFGYCYANYPHVGRHILEVYNARDDEAPDHHVKPMHQIAGDFYLWFGSNTSRSYDEKRLDNIKKWFEESNMESVVGRQWGDPKLAIGWLPVASLNKLPKIEDLVGLKKITKVYIETTECSAVW